MEKGQAEFQMLDNYVKEYSIRISEKIPENEIVDFNGKIGFILVNVEKKDEEWIGEIEVLNDIEIFVKKEKKGEIHISMGGLFSGEKQLQQDKFEEMLKINGSATLSQFIRTYIHANTSLSGMPSIRMPMINFIDLFSNEKKKNNRE